jgi:hypothetical protein
MNMPKFFRSRRPKPAPTPARLDVQDALIASWHGLSEAQCRDLPSLVKADHRESYHRAWGLGR